VVVHSYILKMDAYGSRTIRRFSTTLHGAISHNTTFFEGYVNKTRSQLVWEHESTIPCDI
jgi:hypothetical protein